MNWPEKLQLVSDEAVAQFAVITTVTAIVPIEDVQGVGASTADFDFLAPVANHLYFIENLSVIEIVSITGNPLVRAYDIAAAIQNLFNPQLIANEYVAKHLWCTRLAHLQNGASGGTYSIVFNGFDLTYT